MYQPKIILFDPENNNPFPFYPLKLAIDDESVHIYIDMGDEKDPIHIVYWHADECEEDGSVMCSVATAIQFYYTDPQKLLDTLGYDFKVVPD